MCVCNLRGKKIEEGTWSRKDVIYYLKLWLYYLFIFLGLGKIFKPKPVEFWMLGCQDQCYQQNCIKFLRISNDTSHINYVNYYKEKILEESLFFLSWLIPYRTFCKTTYWPNHKFGRRTIKLLCCETTELNKFSNTWTYRTAKWDSLTTKLAK